MKQNYEEIIRATDRMLDSGVGITAPFLGYAPQTFPRGKGVLYVGKATRGDFGLESYLAARSSSMSDRVEERKSKARAVFEDYRGSMFWHFAARIGDAVDPKAEQYSNIAWSNLVKIGVPEGNPDLRLHSHTFALNVAALQHEIRELEPAIVVSSVNVTRKKS